VTTLDPAVRAAHRRGAAFADLVRPQTARLPLAIFLVAGLGRPGWHLVGGALLILSTYGLAAAYNDLRDVAVGCANGRGRPLATGALTTQDARVAMGVCAVGIVVAQVPLDQPLGVAVTIAAIAGSIAYSHPAIALGRRGLLGTVLLAVLYLVTPALLAAKPLSPAVLATLVAGGTATLLYKDVKDESGDRLFGKRTPLVRWGAARMDVVAGALGAVALLTGLVFRGPGWWTLAQLGGLATQFMMATTGFRGGRLLTAHRLIAVVGLAGLVS
jgi:4-hydroxybenzoate polyprenyltransferase